MVSGWFGAFLLRPEAPPNVSLQDCRSKTTPAHSRVFIGENLSAASVACCKEMPKALWTQWGQPSERSRWIAERSEWDGRGPRRARPQLPRLIWAVCNGTLENARAAVTLARRLGVPLVVSFHDPPAEPDLAGRLRLMPRLRAGSLVRAADVVCTPDWDLRPPVIGDFGLEPDRGVNIPSVTPSSSSPQSPASPAPTLSAFTARSTWSS